jgi:hypothetical protein
VTSDREVELGTVEPGTVEPGTAPVIATLKGALQQSRRCLATADPDRVATAQAATLVEVFAEIERLGATGRVLFSRRAADAAARRDEGHRSAACWIAAKTKTARRDASLETAKALGSLPATSAALRRGELSLAQAREITSAAARPPRDRAASVAGGHQARNEGATGALRPGSGNRELRPPENERHRAIYKSRYLRHYRDAEGAFRLDARLTPDAGTQLISAIEAEAKVVFDEARKSLHFAWYNPRPSPPDAHQEGWTAHHASHGGWSRDLPLVPLPDRCSAGLTDLDDQRRAAAAVR